LFAASTALLLELKAASLLFKAKIFQIANPQENKSHMYGYF
jgi:hypothetical protein